MNSQTEQNHNLSANQPRSALELFTRSSTQNSKALSAKWVEAIQRLWERMASKYGFNEWEWRYGGGSLGNPAFEEWATELSKIQPEATAKALNNLPERIPSLPAFMALARSYETKPMPKPETPEERRERLRLQDQMSRKIKKEMSKGVKRLDPVTRGKMKHMILKRWPGPTHWEGSAFDEWLKEQDELDRQIIEQQNQRTQSEKRHE